MAFLANLYPLRQLLYGYPILLYGVMLSIACACLLKWEETGVPGGNPRKHGENMQTPHRKARAGPETNPGPSCCEATALTTAPLRHCATVPPPSTTVPKVFLYNASRKIFNYSCFLWRWAGHQEPPLAYWYTERDNPGTLVNTRQWPRVMCAEIHCYARTINNSKSHVLFWLDIPSTCDFKSFCMKGFHLSETLLELNCCSWGKKLMDMKSPCVFLLISR